MDELYTLSCRKHVYACLVSARRPLCHGLLMLFPVCYILFSWWVMVIACPALITVACSLSTCPAMCLHFFSFSSPCVALLQAFLVCVFVFFDLFCAFCHVYLLWPSPSFLLPDLQTIFDTQIVTHYCRSLAVTLYIDSGTWSQLASAAACGF